MALDARETILECKPSDIALKSFFLGPQSENAEWLKSVFEHVLESYVQWRQSVYPDDGRAISEQDVVTPEFRANREQFMGYVNELLRRFEAEVPKFSPRYIGHMFSETSMPAMVGHVMTLLHNPNNISGESSRVGVAIEQEAIAALTTMLGFKSRGVQGHFTSGGTVANFEAMVRARQRMERFLAIGAWAREKGRESFSLFQAAHMGWDSYDELRRNADEESLAIYSPGNQNPFVVAQRFESVFGRAYRGPVVLVPEHKHYSWVKGVDLMGLGREAFWPVRLDEQGVMSVAHLKARIEEARRQARPILMVVSVAGTTELGAFDPVDEVQDLLDRYRQNEGIHIWHHVDAAYGGFFATNVCAGQSGCAMEGGACEALAAIRRTNSVTLDPHKLGYVPYASGAFVCAQEREYFANSIDAPYLVFDHQRDRGPQTIEGSRSAAGAVATWLTAHSIGLNKDGYGRILRRAILARRRLQAALEALDLPVRIVPSSANILAFCVAKPGEPLSETNARTARIYDAFSPYRDGEFFVSQTALRFSAYEELLANFVTGWDAECDADDLMLIRLCIMNPFFDSRETNVDFPDAFARALEEALAEPG